MVIYKLIENNIVLRLAGILVICVKLTHVIIRCSLFGIS